MSAAMRSLVGEGRWVVAIAACLLIPLLGMGAGFASTAVVLLWLYGSDVDGVMNVFFFGPVGALAGFAIGAVVGSSVVRWARDAEAHR